MKWLILIAVFCSSTVLAGVRVDVEGQGATQDSAKKDAFRRAIERVVGMVVVSDQEAQGNKLTKDSIGNYSSGYIEDYEILDSYQEPDGMWTVQMSVKVADSKIAQRMMTRSQNNTNINGSKISDSMASEIEMRQNGDALLGTVLGSYPEHAYVVNSGQSTFTVGRLRQPYVDMDYSLSLSKSWVESLNEAVGLVAASSNNCNSLSKSLARGFETGPRNSDAVKDLAKRACGKDPDIQIVSKKSGDFLSKNYSYTLPDQLTLDTINNTLQTPMGMQHIGLRVDLIDAGGQVFDSRCARLDNRTLIYWEAPTGVYNLRDGKRLMRPVVLGTSSFNGSLRINLRSPQQIQDLARVKLSVQKTCD